MYNISIILYALAVHIASLFHKKARLLTKGQHETWTILKQKVEKDKKYIWIHAASLGEFEQGRPLIEKIKAERPEYKILLTFFSPSGYEVRKDYPLADIVCYLPFDTPFNVTRFFSLVKPKKAFFIKYEFWPNYFLQMRVRKIELYSVSSIFRPQQHFFHWYGWFIRPILHNVTHFFVQDHASQELLKTIGISDNVTIVGDTRFDRVKAIMEQSKPLPLVQTFVDQAMKSNCRMLMVAGSSWPKDEDLLIDYFNNHPEMRLIIAPHEIHEEHLKYIMNKLTRPYARYTTLTPDLLPRVECLIIDCFGILSSIYRYADVAYIGGGFGAGIHNILEAAVYGIPVIWGPNYQKFKEAKDLINAKGGHAVHDKKELDLLLDRYLTQKEAIEQDGNYSAHYVKQNLGASDKVLAQIDF